MPFPVVPVVAASGVTALVTYVGVRMFMENQRMENQRGIVPITSHGLDGTAHEVEGARETFYRARRLLEARREKTQGKLESLGRQKAEAFENALIPFDETFARIRNVDLGDTGLPPTSAEVVRGIALGSASESARIRQITAHMADVVAGGVDALGPDTLAALAACGSAGVLLPASDDSTVPAPSGGSAIPAPSGLAAGNATLAWLRGGALPPEDGGTVILGRVAAAPVLLVSGFVLPPRASEEAVEQAASNLLDAEAAARAIGRKAAEVRKALKRLVEGRLAEDLTALRGLVSANDDYRTYDRPQKDLVGRAASLVKTAGDVAEAPLLGVDGGSTDAIRQALKKAKKVLKAPEAV